MAIGGMKSIKEAGVDVKPCESNPVIIQPFIVISGREYINTIVLPTVSCPGILYEGGTVLSNIEKTDYIFIGTSQISNLNFNFTFRDAKALHHLKI